MMHNKPSKSQNTKKLQGFHQLGYVSLAKLMLCDTLHALGRKNAVYEFMNIFSKLKRFGNGNERALRGLDYR